MVPILFRPGVLMVNGVRTTGSHMISIYAIIMAMVGEPLWPGLTKRLAAEMHVL